jgi:hypothetical protein
LEEKQYCIDKLVDIISSVTTHEVTNTELLRSLLERVTLENLKTLLKLHELGINISYYSSKCTYYKAIALYNEGYDLTSFPLLWRDDILTDANTINLTFQTVYFYCSQGRSFEILNYLGEVITLPNHVELIYDLVQLLDLLPNGSLTVDILQEVDFSTLKPSDIPLAKVYFEARMKGVSAELAEKVYKYCQDRDYKAIARVVDTYGVDRVANLVQYVYKRRITKPFSDAGSLIKLLDALRVNKPHLTPIMVTNLKTLESYTPAVVECVKVTKGEVIPSNSYALPDVLEWAYGKGYADFNTNPYVVKHHETFHRYTDRLSGSSWLADLLFEVCYTQGIDWVKYLSILSKLTFLDIQYLALGVDVFGYKGLNFKPSELETIYDAVGKKPDESDVILNDLWCMRFKKYYTR